MEILARGVGRRKEAVAQVQIVKGSGQFIINNIPAANYLHNNNSSLISIKSPYTILNPELSNQNGVTQVVNKDSNNSPISLQEGNSSAKAVGSTGNFEPALSELSQVELNSIDTIVKVKGGGLVGQAEAIKLGVARALCVYFNSNNLDSPRRQLKGQGLLTQDSRVKERRKYGLRKARKASQYHKR